jgi:hypothetical protein
MKYKKQYSEFLFKSDDIYNIEEMFLADLFSKFEDSTYVVVIILLLENNVKDIDSLILNKECEHMKILDHIKHDIISSQLFLRNEIKDLSFNIVKNIIDCDIQGIFFKAEAIESTEISNGYMIKLQEDRFITNANNISYPIYLLSNELIDFLNSNKDFELKLSNCILFSQKVIIDATKQRLLKYNMIIIDKLSKEDSENILRLYPIRLLSISVIYDKLIKQDTIDGSIAEHYNTNYFHIVGQCNTIFIKSYSPIINKNRINTLNSIYDKYESLIYRREISEYTYYDLWISLKDKIDWSNFISEFDNFILYKFRLVKEEIDDEELNRIRKNAILKREMMYKVVDILKIFNN